MSASREAARDALAALLSTALVGTGLAAEAVYGYRVADFGKKRTIVTVSGGGSARERYTQQGNRSTFYLFIHVFVLYADPNTTPAWTEADAEDRLDAVEAIIAGVVQTYRRYAGYWEALDYAERSNVVDLDLTQFGGNEYRVEVIQVKVEVFN
jgi:hypothetical protein